MWDINYPAHIDRAHDPYDGIFQQTRRTLEAQGPLTCSRCGATTNVEIHHCHIEWAMQEGVSLEKFQRHFPHANVVTRDDLRKWVNGPENAQPLCASCHREAFGRHFLPDPLWVLGPLWCDGLPPPVQIFHSSTR